ncbi:hypothetical protein VTK26DRAFT_2298 [Humicola hyalothermophila]
MPITLLLYNGERIDFTCAHESEEDIIRRIAWYRSAVSATADLQQQSEHGRLSSLVAHHLQIEASRCVTEPTEKWPTGSFNKCVPIHVDGQSTGTTAGSQLLLRIPMAHRLTGLVEEKMRCAVATYIWMQENCPDIPIPRLRTCAWFGWPIPSYYVGNPWIHDFPAGYILLEVIDQGKPLANSWFSAPVDPAKRQNLFRGISRLILKLARVPLNRIGSFSFDPDMGTISLTNRPLTSGIAIMENDGAPRKNAVKSREDCYYQMAVQAILRIMSQQYLNRGLRQGPFYMQLADLHPGNLIVDDDWNITSLIDLEWICARSPQMIDIPYWITSRSIDEICLPQYSAEYAAARETFMAAFKEEERGMSGNLPKIIEKSYSSKALWFFHALDSINAMYQLFELQLRPQYIPQRIPEKVGAYFAVFWAQRLRETTMRKLREREEYDAEPRAMFRAEADLPNENPEKR